MINFTIYYSIICIIILISINFLLKKNHFLLHYNYGKHHKKKSSDQICLSGGIYYFICFVTLTFFLDQSSDNLFQHLYFIIALAIIVFVGILSDLNIFSEPKKRLFFLFFSLSILALEGSYFIESLDLKFFPENKIFLSMFSIFCILIVINGFNFLDGTDGNSSIYFLSILYILILLKCKNENIILDQNTKYIIITSLIFTFANIRKINFCGDSGAYCLGFLLSIYLIKFYNNNSVSSLLICNLLFYPAFEVLFSIIRKLSNKKNPLKPETKHLHHLVNSWCYKLLIKFEINKNYYSACTSIIINLIFFTTAYLSISMPYDHVYQFKMLLLNSIIYSFVYFILSIFFKGKI